MTIGKKKKKKSQVPDGQLPPFHRNSVVTRRQRNPKLSLVVSGKRCHLALFVFPPQKWHSRAVLNREHQLWSDRADRD